MEAAVNNDDLVKEVYDSIEANDVQSLSYAIQKGADVNSSFGSPSQHPSSTWAALHLCCRKGHYKCAEALLEQGADVDIVDGYGQTPLMYAVSTEWCNMISLLVKYGTNINHADMRGMASIHQSIGCSDTQCLDILIAYGADMNLRDMLGATPLHHACMEDGHEAHAKQLLAAGCDRDIREAQESYTPLQVAIKYARKDRMTYIKMLMEAGTCPDLIHPGDDLGNHTALMSLIHNTWRYASYASQEELAIVRLLLAAGVDVNISAGFGFREHKQCLRGPALKLAVERGMVEVVDLLLDAGADPNVADNCGATPLHVAALHNRVNIMKKLIRHNSDLEAEGALWLDHKWVTMTPFYCALYRGHQEVAELLVHAGYSLRKEHYLWTNQNVPSYLVTNLNFWLWLREVAESPSPLLGLCCNVVRKHLGSQIQRKVKCLRLPPAIQSLLLLDGLNGLPIGGGFETYINIEKV